MKKLIFAFPVHERFEAAIDLYKSIKLFYPEALVIYASNQDIGESLESLVKFKSTRDYSWGHTHNFLLDAIEYVNGIDYDYLIKLDSDCLVTNKGFEDLVEQGFDFNIDLYKNQYDWTHGWIFDKHVADYHNILSNLGLKQIDKTLVGAIAALNIISKKAATFISDNLKAIESANGYVNLMKVNKLCVDETLIPNILKDAGFKSSQGKLGVERTLIKAIRFKPAWTVEEFEQEDQVDILYHPVSRDPEDNLRIYLKQKLEI